MKSPSRSRGDLAGASIFGTAARRNTHATRHPGDDLSGGDLSGGREADGRRAKHAVLLHQRLHVIRLVPRAGLCHVRDILKDHHIILVFGTAEHSSIRDAGRCAVLLAAIVTRTPCGVVLDLEVDRRIFVKFLLRFLEDIG
jgi:hypothetical protein